ncbi:MAG: phosphate propanoyltransferase [Proteobacteria bacterium]|nr:phosphate propanoyltransferase [Pseudomonadota bacterium]
MNIWVLQCEAAFVRATVIDVEKSAIVRDDWLPMTGDVETVLRQALAAIKTSNQSINAVGHRIAYGGDRYRGPVSIDDSVAASLASLTGPAAVCNQSSLAVMRSARTLLPDVPHIAVFDLGSLIAREVAQLTVAGTTAGATLAVPIAISARHVHLTAKTIEQLFGAGHQLTPVRPLSQPGQYAAEETVTLLGPKGSIENVRVLGPPRPADQVEISRTDEFKLGIDAPVRGSGNLAGTPGITLVGSRGRVVIEEGLICAQRHIHMTPADAARWQVNHGDMVDVAVDTEGRDLEFSDVLVRVSPQFKFEMHVDTDEANAADLSRGDEGVLVPTGKPAVLRRRVLPRA